LRCDTECEEKKRKKVTKQQKLNLGTFEAPAYQGDHSRDEGDTATTNIAGSRSEHSNEQHEKLRKVSRFD